MAKQLASPDITTDTFYGLILRVTDLVVLANTEVVTANNSANGAFTTGKGYVIGNFGSNTISCDTLSGGNTLISRPLTVTTNTVFTGSGVTINSGLNLGSSNTVLSASVTSTATGLTQQAIDTFPTNKYRSAKYVISITSSTFYQTTEIILLHDGTNTYSTEYATIYSAGQLASFTSDVLSGNVRLLINPAISPIAINIHKTLIAI